MPIKLPIFILLVLYNGLSGLYIDMLQNVTKKVERTVYIDNKNGRNEPIHSRNPILQVWHRETISTEAFKTILSYLELDPNQADEDLAILDLYLKDNQATMTKQRYISTTVSIHIFKIGEREYRKEMNNTKSIASLMIKASVGEESIGIETSDSS